MSIKIGNNNKIKYSSIIDNGNNGKNDNNNNNNTDNKDVNPKSFSSKHPILTSIICSVIGSIIMMFSFWDKISYFIKNLL
ncbi:hypothetical protein CYK62_11115 [Clostridium perfringens]|uniref:hypothetical protein n=1 Tax=Clostridium perfringens TaxID=1502 RepID=UPI000D716CF1|nr:hypothetical protein [Clostridium perfringens]MBO3320262.1 hypothetical protein [Clostridium perfringens]PWX20491.1 hypothetical protein CYK62_11115 [Clostridium perfringens]